MADRPPDQEPAYLRERAATLREMAANPMPASIVAQLLEVAADLNLEKRAALIELKSSPPPVT